MNCFKHLLTVGALLTAVQTFAASQFEGKVDLAITAERGAPQALTYSIKDQLLRIDMQAEGKTFSSIIDSAKQEMLILMPEEQMYMVMPIKQAVEKASKAGNVDMTAEIERTGKTETILGYKCDQLLVKDKGQVTELWVAEGLGTFMGLGSGSGGGGGLFGGGKKATVNAKWEEALKGNGGFPLRVISRDAKSKQTFKMEATKVSPGTLPASTFQPPAGFQKFAMPDLGGFNPFKK